MADRIVVMHDGLVEQVGAPLELYDRPANMFVAGFIGSPAMNFLPGRIRTNGRATFLGNGGLEIPLGFAPAASHDRPIVLGIRPEHFTVAPDGVPVEVVVVEPTGSETLLAVRAGSQEMTCLFRDRVLPQPGETIRIRPDPDLVHVFDEQTGVRLPH